MFLLGLLIVTIAICWCCIGACCHRMAKRQHAGRRSEVAGGGGGADIEAIPPVAYVTQQQDLRVQYQMVYPQMQPVIVPPGQARGGPAQPLVVCGLYPGQ
jgi:hypothetical protein